MAWEAFKGKAWQVAQNEFSKYLMHSKFRLLNFTSKVVDPGAAIARTHAL